jgi:hypothetical protein
VSVLGKLDGEIVNAIIDCLLLSQKDDIPPIFRDLLRPPLQAALLKLKEKYSKGN